MTPDQMEAIREKIVKALRDAGFEDVEPLDFEPPSALPIAFRSDDNDLVLELNVM